MKYGILALMLVLCVALSGIASARSNCPANSMNRCNCPNGRYEIYTSISKVQEARKDPNSCCYRPPTVARSTTIYQQTTQTSQASITPTSTFITPTPIQQRVIVHEWGKYRLYLDLIAKRIIKVELIDQG